MWPKPARDKKAVSDNATQYKRASHLRLLRNESDKAIQSDVPSTGASQVYFTPVLGQVCGTTGAGGCAIQASQSGLN